MKKFIRNTNEYNTMRTTASDVTIQIWQNLALNHIDIKNDKETTSKIAWYVMKHFFRNWTQRFIKRWCNTFSYNYGNGFSR